MSRNHSFILATMLESVKMRTIALVSTTTVCVPNIAFVVNSVRISFQAVPALGIVPSLGCALAVMRIGNATLMFVGAVPPPTVAGNHADVLIWMLRWQSGHPCWLVDPRPRGLGWDCSQRTISRKEIISMRYVKIVLLSLSTAFFFVFFFGSIVSLKW